MGALSLQNVFTSQVVFSWSYEGQLPEPNLFLTSRIFTSIQSKSLLEFSGPVHLQEVETVTGFFVSRMYMGCPSSYAVQLLQDRRCGSQQGHTEEEARWAESTFLTHLPFHLLRVQLQHKALYCKHLSFASPASSGQLCSSQRPTLYVIYIFITTFKMQKKKKKKKTEWGMNKASSCWRPDILFGAWSLSNLFASACHVHQHGALGPTWPQVSRWTERIHTGQLLQPFDLNKALTLTGTDPKKDGSNALGFQSHGSTDSWFLPQTRPMMMQSRFPNIQQILFRSLRPSP